MSYQNLENNTVSTNIIVDNPNIKNISINVHVINKEEAYSKHYSLKHIGLGVLVVASIAGTVLAGVDGANVIKAFDDVARSASISKNLLHFFRRMWRFNRSCFFTILCGN